MEGVCIQNAKNLDDQMMIIVSCRLRSLSSGLRTSLTTKVDRVRGGFPFSNSLCCAVKTRVDLVLGTKFRLESQDT